MGWRVRYSRAAERALEKLAPDIRARIVKTVDRAARSEQPHVLAEPLVGDWTGYWRLRAGDYRIICRLEQDILMVSVVKIAHRREVYRGPPS